MESKYGKYIFEYDNSYQFGVESAPFKVINRIDGDVEKGFNFYLFHWVMPHDEPWEVLGHPPHIHKDAELLFHIGTDPNNPQDLGSEIELCLGKEMEKHIITRTCVIYIPPYFIHCPWKPLKTTRPFIFAQIHQGPVHTEKGYHQILPPEMLELVHTTFHDEGFHQ